MKRCPIVLVNCLGLAALAALAAGCTPRPAAGEQKTPEESKPSPRGAHENQAAPTLHEVEVAPNIAYYNGADADKARQKLDVYSPKGAKKRPVVLFIHGGAWVFGDKDYFGIHAAVGRMFARHGIVAVVANYRLSPKVRHPEHIKDVARAFAWTRLNIARYGGRTDQLFLCGHSAGGHLVSLLATDESYLKAEGRAFSDIKGVMAISGVYEIPEKMFLDVFGKDPKVHRQAGPMMHVKAGCPPFLILYADKDYLFCDVQSEKFAKALRAKKVAARTQRIKERNHLDIIGNTAKDNDPCARTARFHRPPHGSEPRTQRSGVSGSDASGWMNHSFRCDCQYCTKSIRVTMSTTLPFASASTPVLPASSRRYASSRCTVDVQLRQRAGHDLADRDLRRDRCCRAACGPASLPGRCRPACRLAAPAVARCRPSACSSIASAAVASGLIVTSGREPRVCSRSPIEWAGCSFKCSLLSASQSSSKNLLR